MSAAFGISLGSTTACIAVYRDGKSHVIANDLGDRVTPSVVSFADNDISVGLAAKQLMIRNIENTVVGAKNLLGKSFESPEIADILSKNKVKIINKEGVLTYQVKYKEKTAYFTPYEILIHLFKKIMETAKSHESALDSYDAVVTIPVYFTQPQIRLVKQAATEANFNVLRMVSEPSATLLAYQIGQNDPTENWKVLVFHVGGQTLDINLVTVNSGMYVIKASLMDLDSGSSRVDDILTQHLVSEFKRQSRLDCTANSRALVKLSLAAEMVKRALSTLTTAHASIDSLHEGVDFSCNVSRSRLDQLVSAYVVDCLMRKVRDLLERAEVGAADVDKIVLSGGYTKTPLLQQKLREIFAKAEIHSAIASDEVQAVGAAYEAGILIGRNVDQLEKFAESCDLPTLSSDILIRVKGKPKPRILFNKGTPIPFKKQIKFNLPAAAVTPSIPPSSPTSPSSFPSTTTEGNEQENNRNLNNSCCLRLLQRNRIPTANVEDGDDDKDGGGLVAEGEKSGGEIDGFVVVVDGGRDVVEDGDDDYGGDRRSFLPLCKIVLPDLTEDETAVNAVFHIRHDGSMHITCSSVNDGTALASLEVDSTMNLPFSSGSGIGGSGIGGSGMGGGLLRGDEGDMEE